MCSLFVGFEPLTRLKSSRPRAYSLFALSYKDDLESSRYGYFAADVAGNNNYSITIKMNGVKRKNRNKKYNKIKRHVLDFLKKLNLRVRTISDHVNS